MSKIYVDTRPLGSGRIISRTSGFFAREFPVDEKFAAGVEKLQADWELVQHWLAYEYEQIARRDHTVEIPKEIKEIVCPEAPKEKQRKPKATAAPSNSKSQSKRKKIQSASTTSRKKAQ